MRSFALVLLLTSVLSAQNPLTDAIAARYNSAKQNLMGAAAAMPEEDYGYKLTPPQRPFGEWIQHTAMGNLSFCSAIGGTAAPDMAAVHAAHTKADLQKALADSFALCDAALGQMNDAKALQSNSGKYPVTAMVALIASLNEHYGNLVGYLRSKGITPPSTARSKAVSK